MNKYLIRYKRVKNSKMIITYVMDAPSFDDAVEAIKAVVSDDGGEILMVQRVSE